MKKENDKKINSLPDYNIILKTLNRNEKKLFFDLIAKLQKQSSSTIELKAINLEQEYGITYDKLPTTLSKLMKLTFIQNKNDDDIVGLVIFSYFHIRKMTIEITFNENANEILRNIEPWIISALEDYQTLKSNYAKIMFSALQHFRSIKEASFSKQELFDLLKIKKSYWNRLENVNSRIFQPILLELAPFFINIKLSKIHSPRRGNPIIGFTFTWQKYRNHE